MKRFLVFILAFLMTISIVTTTFAIVKSDESDLMRKYTGFWYRTYLNKVSDVINIGLDYDKSVYVLEVYRTSPNDILSSERYNLTYDSDEDLFYLTNRDDLVWYKMKKKEGKILLTLINGSTSEYEKLSP